MNILRTGNVSMGNYMGKMISWAREPKRCYILRDTVQADISERLKVDSWAWNGGCLTLIVEGGELHLTQSASGGEKRDITDIQMVPNVHRLSACRNIKCMYKLPNSSWRESGGVLSTHCSSARLSCLRSRSGCHTSSGPGCSCYSRSGIHEVHRSFHLFSSGANKNADENGFKRSMNINAGARYHIFYV